jgi:PKD repeat protein
MKLKFFIVLLFSIISVYGIGQIPTNGLIAWYPFNGNANDASGNGNNGTVYGASLVNDRFGNSNSAYSFDGSNYIDILSTGIPNNPEVLTECAWVKTTSNGQCVILTRRHLDDGTDWPTLMMQGDKGVISADDQGYKIDAITTSPINDGVWHFIVGIRNHEMFSVYFDGQLQATITTSYSFGGSILNLHIGHHGAWNSWFNGTLDDISIYSRVLSFEEIQQLYYGCTGASPIVSTSPVINIQGSSAHSGGTVICEGSSVVTSRGVCWSTQPNPTLANNHSNEGGGSGEYTSLITGLSLQTLYYLRAYATNSQGTSFGSQIMFTTLVADPIIGASGTFVFDTKPPAVTLLGPNGGQSFTATQVIPVTWTATDEQIQLNPVTIKMSSAQNGIYQTLQQNLPNSGNKAVQPLCISTQYGRFQVNVSDKFGNIGHDESDNCFTVTSSNFLSLTADFIASNIQPKVGQQVLFTDESLGIPTINAWQWIFSDGSSSTLRNPTHVFSEMGIYDVSLKVGNGTGNFDTKTKTIAVGSNANGIDLEIIETGGTEIITDVGFYNSDAAYFSVVPSGNKRWAHITFGTSSGPNHGMEKNTIYLYHKNGSQYEQRGHIFFEYDYSKEKEFDRNAILFLHNDPEMCGSVPKYYPYDPDDSNNPLTKKWWWKKWDYYKNNEYPVSMLIPPDNYFPAYFNKQPILFVHGLYGKYELSELPDADPKFNEVSYWYTTVHITNENGFQGWQIYYPYDSDIEHISYCLKNAVNWLYNKYQTNNYKIGIVTHSMGGLVTAKYLTSNPSDKNKIKKVLFCSPPIHGSYGGNLCYKNSSWKSFIAEKFKKEINRVAPAPKDLSLGSKFQWDINSKNWNVIDLNTNGTLSDDYFVLIGTTKAQYLSDVAGSAINEAYQHNDGIVSMSSASLLDKGIGFATIHGNHSDAIHAQSIDKWWNTNIHNKYLIPDIINSYFNSTYSDFLNFIRDLPEVKAVVKEDGTIHKPAVSGITLTTINAHPNYSTGEDDVNYQNGLFNFRILLNESLKENLREEYHAFYNWATQKLILSTSNKSPTNYFKIGKFQRNLFINDDDNVQNYYSYYYTVVNPALLLDGNGCAIQLQTEQATGIKNRIIIYKEGTEDNLLSSAVEFPFGYCRSTLLTIGGSTNKFITPDSLNNQTDNKNGHILAIGQIPPDTLGSFYHIDDQTTRIKFVLSSLAASDNNIPLKLIMKLPDGTVIDSSFSSGSYSKDTTSGQYVMTINNPMVGKWKVWAESNHMGADTIKYSAVTYVMSDIYSYMINDTAKAIVGTNFQIIAGLQMDTLSLSDSLVLKATVTKPNGDTLIYNMSSTRTDIDTAYKFTQMFLPDTVGYYSIKLNYDGVYNGHRFERALFHQFEANDTTVSLKIPDVQLTVLSNTTNIDLRNYAFNYDCPYDSLTFTSTILSSNVTSPTFTYSMNDTTWKVTLSSNLSDTGTIVIKYSMHLPDNNVVRDTIVVHIALPDLKIMNHAINISTVYTDSTMIVSCQILNQGNTYSGSFHVKYFLSTDSIYSSSDIPIGERIIYNLELDSTISIIDTIMIPSVTNAGNYYLIYVADPDNIIKEINDTTNNVGKVSIQINRLPIMTIKLYLEGLFNSANGSMNKAQDASSSKFSGAVADLISISLASVSPPYTVIKTFNNVPLDTNGHASITIPQNLAGPYYIVVNHRNSLETWSIVPIAIDSLILHFDFTLSEYAAFGNRLKNIGTKYIIYIGDVNQDGSIDALDMILVGNAKATGVIGYTITDLNGDGVVNDADLILLQNNASSFIMSKRP